MRWTCVGPQDDRLEYLILVMARQEQVAQRQVGLLTQDLDV
jgi:hypothetical protein